MKPFEVVAASSHRLRASLSQAVQRAWLSRGPLARALWPLSLLTCAWLAVRRGRQPPSGVPVPVLVVGNLIVGGAGKTPTVMAVVMLLRRHGYTPGVVSRGHGRSATGVLAVAPGSTPADCGDEPLLLRIRLGVPVYVGRDRVAAGLALLRANPQVDILVADDGLQHRRLPRQAAVIVFDERGAGNRWLLPAGPLREPMSRSPPARSVVLYNAPWASTPWPGHLARRALAGAVSLDGWWAGDRASGDTLLSLRERPVMALAGLARPERFFTMLRDAGFGSGTGGRLTECRLPDHYDFARLPWPAASTDVLLTEKDAVKLQPGRCGATRVWVAPLDFGTPPAFDDELLALLATS